MEGCGRKGEGSDGVSEGGEDGKRGREVEIM